MLNVLIKSRVLKKMRDEGVLVAGAPPGRKGAGCFKVSQEEKSRIADAAKAAAKKLKAQQKQGLGKVILWEIIFPLCDIDFNDGHFFQTMRW